MIRRLIYALLIATSVCFAAAQEPTTPSPPPQTEESPSPSPSISPEQPVTPTTTPTQTASASPPANVRISFIPPPLEGTISLGIYDKSGNLVRVLHQQANLTDFTIGADAL